MDKHPLPARKAASAAALDRALLVTLEEMLDDDETITARAAVRRMGSVEAASSLTRDPWRAAVLADHQAEQVRIRRQIEKSDKTSRTNVTAALAREQGRAADLERKVALLTASHLALIQAVGEMGGLRAWARFFDGYDGAVRQLRALGAMPDAEVMPLPPTGPAPRRRREG